MDKCKIITRINWTKNKLKQNSKGKKNVRKLKTGSKKSFTVGFILWKNVFL